VFPERADLRIPVHSFPECATKKARNHLGASHAARLNLIAEHFIDVHRSLDSDEPHESLSTSCTSI